MIKPRRYYQVTVHILAAMLLLVSAAFAQEQAEKRKPAIILRPEQAGILLSEGRINLEQPEKTLNFLSKLWCAKQLRVGTCPALSRVGR